MITRTGRLKARGLGNAGVTALGVLAAFAVATHPLIARADDAGVTSDVSISPEPSMPRFLPDGRTAPPHLSNFSPAAINFLDCMNDVSIEFTLDLTDTPDDSEIQVWAGAGSAQCTQVAARTPGTVSQPEDFPGLCWPAASPTAFSVTGKKSTARVRVRDLVAHIDAATLASATYTPSTDLSVCEPLSTVGAVPLNIYFIFQPVGSTKPTVQAGLPGFYGTTAALVGPYAPTDVNVPNSGITATSLTVNWAPTTDSAIQGYNIYAQDQGVNGVSAAPSPEASSKVIQQIVCHPQLPCDAGNATSSDTGAGDAGSGDAGSDAEDLDATKADAKHADAIADGSKDSGDSTVRKVDAALEAATSNGTCDGGRSPSFVVADPADYPDATAASLAAVGCQFENPVLGIQQEAGTGQVCTSVGVISSVFTVDAGTGTSFVGAAEASVVTTVTTDTTDAGLEGSVVTEASTLNSPDAAGTVVTTTGVSVQNIAGISAIPSKYLAGYAATQSANTFALTGLTTGHQYAVGVAAVDLYGNVGPIGPLGCSTPTAVDDFFMRYTEDGGRAGGGFCSLAAPGAPAFGGLFGLGLASAAAAFLRRRSQRARSRRAP